MLTIINTRRGQHCLHSSFTCHFCKIRPWVKALRIISWKYWKRFWSVIFREKRLYLTFTDDWLGIPCILIPYINIYDQLHRDSIKPLLTTFIYIHKATNESNLSNRTVSMYIWNSCASISYMSIKNKGKSVCEVSAAINCVSIHRLF